MGRGGGDGGLPCTFSSALFGLQRCLLFFVSCAMVAGGGGAAGSRAKSRGVSISHSNPSTPLILNTTYSFRFTDHSLCCTVGRVLYDCRPPKAEQLWSALRSPETKTRLSQQLWYQLVAHNKHIRVPRILPPIVNNKRHHMQGIQIIHELPAIFAFVLLVKENAQTRGHRVGRPPHQPPVHDWTFIARKVWPSFRSSTSIEVCAHTLGAFRYLINVDRSQRRCASYPKKIITFRARFDRGTTTVIDSRLAATPPNRPFIMPIRVERGLLARLLYRLSTPPLPSLARSYPWSQVRVPWLLPASGLFY